MPGAPDRVPMKQPTSARRDSVKKGRHKPLKEIVQENPYSPPNFKQETSGKRAQQTDEHVVRDCPKIRPITIAETISTASNTRWRRSRTERAQG